MSNCLTISDTYVLNDYAVIVQQCFRAISVSSTELLVEVQSISVVSFIKEIRHLLTVQDPNALYVFMYCLSSVDPQLWAGTTPEIPSVLEEWEVERIMKALDCEDKLIRKQVAIPAIIAVTSLLMVVTDTSNTLARRRKYRGVVLCKSPPRRFAIVFDKWD